jgi:hypothetical protein
VTADPPSSSSPPASELRFADGRKWRVEIPSVEGPAALEAVLDEAARRGVQIDRISQGSGISMLLDRELETMVAAARERDIELSLFVGPRAEWDIGAAVLSPGGAGTQVALRGRRQLDDAVADVERAVALGLRNVLIGDLGLLTTIQRRRASGDLPGDLRVKFSALAAPSNPVAAAVLASLGADSINILSDHSVAEIADFRAAMTAELDIYIEAPDGSGGFVRYHDIPEIVRVAAPVHLKFGLRNAAGIYPAGAHLQGLVEASARERVRRAELGLEHLARAANAEPEGVARA